MTLSEYLACKEGQGAVMNLDRAVYQRIGDIMRQIGVRPDAKAFSDDVTQARKAWEEGDLPEAVRLMEQIERKLASKHYSPARMESSTRRADLDPFCSSASSDSAANCNGLCAGPRQALVTAMYCCPVWRQAPSARAQRS